ncbi:MAG: pitrilysin family protein [Burkholderiaceae bacterium]
MVGFAKWTLALGVWIVVALAPVRAQQTPVTLPPGVALATTVEGITEFHLDNGLQVLLVPDAAKPTTTVNVTYRVGSRHENYGETGMAHLLEHLLFKGTPTLSNLLGEFGRRGLRANGTTSFDRTNYFASFAANDENLRWYLAWQADAMVNSRIARADLDTEMTVVRNELERSENDSNRITWQHALAAMYRWHNYGKSVLGARADVENVDIARLQAFYRRYYQPDNATLIVAGSFDSAKTLAWIAESFGPLTRPQRVLHPTYTLDEAQDGERSVTVRRVGGTPLMYLGYHAPAAAHPDYAAVDLLTQVLGGTPSGRLHKRLVQTRLAASTFGFDLGLAEPGAVFFGAQLAPAQDVARAQAELIATIESLASEPVSAAELERARSEWLADWERGFTDPERIGVALSSAISQGDWRLYFKARDQIRAVTLADMQRVATQRFVPANRTFAVYLPTDKPVRAPAPERVDVAALVKEYRGDASVAQAESFDPTPANLDARTERFTLASGMQAALLPKGARGRLVNARLSMRYGDVPSLANQAAVARFVAALLDKGGAGLTREQIRDELTRLRAQVSFSAGRQSVNAGIVTTRDNLPEVIALVGRLLREPAFPADALEEARRQSLVAIERNRHEPGPLLSNTLNRHANPYPMGDLRYVPTFDEQAQLVGAVTEADLRTFHRRFYSAADAEFAAVGDLDVARTRSALEAAFGTWSAPTEGRQRFNRAPDPYLAPQPQRFVLPTPDRQNANLLAVLDLPLADTDPQYPALLLANQLFGGGLSSRLWTRIRERDGLSYGVGSGIDWNSFEANSRWTASATFAPQNRARIEAALREEVERSLRDGFTQVELDQARMGLLAARRLARAQDAGIAAMLVSNLYLQRDFARQQKIDDALAKTTLDQVNAAWRAHARPDQWAIGFGGDFKL